MVSDDSDGNPAMDLNESFPMEDLREPQGPQNLLHDNQNGLARSRLRKRKKKSSSGSVSLGAGVDGATNSANARLSSLTGAPAVLGIDPTASLNVFSNLVLAEDSLRRQYMDLQKNRRNGLIFFYTSLGCAVYLTIVVLWRESIYHWFRLLERLLMVAAYISLGLFFLTGLARKVFVTAPSFLNETNKGLKEFNLRLVKAQTSFRETIFRFCFNPVYMDRRSGLVKLVLGPRSFSPQSIEAWELYREEFWAREERRLRRRKTKTSANAVTTGVSSSKKVKKASNTLA